MLRCRVNFSLISTDAGDKAFWQPEFMIKLSTPHSELNPSELGISANPKSPIPIFTDCFKTGIRQTGVDREALDQVPFIVQQINAAVLHQDGQILALDPFGIKYSRTLEQ